MQPFCHQYTLLRTSETHVNQIIHDRQNISQPGILRQTLGTSRAIHAHRQVVKINDTIPVTERREKHHPPSSRHNENILAGNFAHTSFHPCQTPNFICTRAAQPYHDVGRCTRARKPSDVFATVVRINLAHYPHAPSNISITLDVLVRTRCLFTYDEPTHSLVLAHLYAISNNHHLRQPTTEFSFTVLRETSSALIFTRLLVLGVVFYEVSLPRNVFFYSEGSPTSLFRTYMIKHWPF